MDIVYTYKIPIYPVPNRDKYQKEWINISAESAKKVGYRTVLYTNDKTILNSQYLDQVIYSECTSRLWDSLKIKVLETRYDKNYFLADYDIIFQNKLSFEDKYDLFIDGYETHKGTWNLVYRTPSTYIDKELKLPYWNSNPRPVMNVGILKFNKPELQKRYVKLWKELEYSTIPLDLNSNFLTATITQLLLTLLAESYKTKNFTEGELGTPNINYQHFIGAKKLEKIGLKVVI